MASQQNKNKTKIKTKIHKFCLIIIYTSIIIYITLEQQSD